MDNSIAKNRNRRLIKPARIAFVCEGDAEKDAFSGSAKSIVDNLRALGHTIFPINVRPSKPWRLAIAILTFSFNRARWRARFRYGKIASKARSLKACRMMVPLDDQVDIVFQIGATFTPPVADSHIPYVLYCDWNMALSIRNSANNHSASGGLTKSEAEDANTMQHGIYAHAARIFTISERLRESFIEDYRISAEHVVRAYAGANLDLMTIPPVRPVDHDLAHNPTILFIGKEFVRKGGDVLLRAFQIVRQKVPNARLLIIGTTNIDTHDNGVEFVGLLRKEVLHEHKRLIHAFTESDVFCLPSRLEPLGIVVCEAMFFSLPCVVSNIWAMPEMVIDGETGFTVPVDNAEALAEKLIRILTNRQLGRQMGIAARKRAEKLFTWSSSAQIMHEHIQQVAYH